jgi:ABC-type multidrug transport system fused ATPase/permease subunit
LSQINFSCAGGTKIGIVGRTGAGKSTLSLAFFRILPFSHGKIEIDGIDISHLHLHELRKRLTIIPQDPVLFSGTLRTNLDPFDEHDDVKLWDCLKQVHFLETTQETVNLDSIVTENGHNYSQGQRQLLCMARALLRNSKVVILDEATASVDNETDARIQECIRHVFRNATVLTIAHRLRTIADYDKVLVLDHGQVVEYGAPNALLQDESGWFRSMCEETGEISELMELSMSSSYFK